jgi:hypothetical protein
MAGVKLFLAVWFAGWLLNVVADMISSFRRTQPPQGPRFLNQHLSQMLLLFFMWPFTGGFFLYVKLTKKR